MIDGNDIVKRVQSQQADPSWQIVTGKDRAAKGLIGRLLGFRAPILVFLDDGLVISDESAPEDRQSKIKAFAYEAVLSLKSVPRGRNIALIVNEEQHRRYKEPPIEIVLEHAKWDDPQALALRVETAWQSCRGRRGYPTLGGASPVLLGNTPPLPSLFVFGPGNQAFVEGKTDRYEGVSYGAGIAVMIVGTILMSFFLFFVDPLFFRNIPLSSSLSLLAALWANTLSAVTLLAGILWFRRTFRLKNRAQRLYGELVTCRAEVDHTSSADENSVAVRYYKLQVRFRFRTPDGDEIVKKADTGRDDLEGKSLPGPGTPVAIQYVNRRLLELL